MRSLRAHTRRAFLASATAAATGTALGHVPLTPPPKTPAPSGRKGCILIWLGGGPSTIDMWDLKPESHNGGEFKPIETAGEAQICEHLAKTAQVMDRLSIVRTMSTGETDHARGRYKLQTGFTPNPVIMHPHFGSVVSAALGSLNSELPPFVSNGDAAGPGYLGIRHAPVLVSRSRLHLDEEEATEETGAELVEVWRRMEHELAAESAPGAYADEPFGQSLRKARYLLQHGTRFVQVEHGGYDNHTAIFSGLKKQLPVFDAGLSALIEDLTDREMLDDVVVVVAGEFGRTPRLNGNGGRDHWAEAWSVVIGGGGLRGGLSIGSTDRDGVTIEDGQPYDADQLWATVAHALGIPPQTSFDSRRAGRLPLLGRAVPIDPLIAKS